MLMVYNYDSDEHKSELFSSYSCGNEILTLDWSHSENAPNSGLVVYGTQEGTLGVFNSLSNTLLHETTVEGVSAVVDVAFSPVMTSYCSALASGPSPLRFWDLASGAMALDGAGVGAGGGSASAGKPWVHDCTRGMPVRAGGSSAASVAGLEGDERHERAEPGAEVTEVGASAWVRA